MNNKHKRLNFHRLFLDFSIFIHEIVDRFKALVLGTKGQSGLVHFSEVTVVLYKFDPFSYSLPPNKDHSLYFVLLCAVSSKSHTNFPKKNETQTQPLYYDP